MLFPVICIRRSRWIRDVSFRFSLLCLVIMAGNRFWYILDWNFRDARGVYNGRLCGRSFSRMSGEFVAVRMVGVLYESG